LSYYKDRHFSLNPSSSLRKALCLTIPHKKNHESLQIEFFSDLIRHLGVGGIDGHTCMNGNKSNIQVLVEPVEKDSRKTVTVEQKL